jgi:hypothetical protein
VITRFDGRTGQRQNIAAWPEEGAGWGAKDIRYRFQWTFPIVLSPHDPDVLYITSQYVHRSTDQGQSWEIISPDLTRNDESKQGPSGGPVTIDSNGMDYYCTIFAFAESPLERGLLWAGSDDGLVHLSRDGGASWENITPPEMPTWSLVSIIEPSPHDAGTAYLAVDRHRHDDFAPYLYRTTDYGKTWVTIVGGLPEDDFARVIRADPERRGLLYAGTEAGLWVSLDDGAHWQLLRLNLPVVPVHDLIVKDGDLVAATHGRGFWILDDLSPLRALSAEALAGEAHLFAPRPTIRYRPARGFSRPPGPGKSYQMLGTMQYTSRQIVRPSGETAQKMLDAGQNPPDGVVVAYHLRQRPVGEVTLTFLDAAGVEVATFKSKPEGGQLADEQKPGEKKETPVPKEAGLNRFVWTMRYPDARNVPGAIYRSGDVTGPLAPPGNYQVRLAVGEQSRTVPFELLKDPRVAASDADLREQFTFLLEIRDKLSETNDAINQLRALREQIGAWESRAQDRDAVLEGAKALKDELGSIEEELIQTRWKSSRDALTAPSKLNVKLATLMGVVGGADGRPTRQSRVVFKSVSERVDAQLRRLDDLVEAGVPRFNALVRAQDLPALTIDAAQIDR